MRKTKFQDSKDVVFEKSNSNSRALFKSYFGELLIKRNKIKTIKQLCIR